MGSLLLGHNCEDNLSKILFLDRDGTLIENVPYLHKPEDIQWLPGVLSTLKVLQKHGWSFCVVSNQSGVARGLYELDDIKKVEASMVETLALFNVSVIDWNYCLHHPDITGECDCRKPKPGMIHQLIDRNSLTIEKSFMVGDKDSDVEAGVQAGMQGVLIQKGLREQYSKLLFNEFGNFGAWLLK